MITNNLFFLYTLIMIFCIATTLIFGILYNKFIKYITNKIFDMETINKYKLVLLIFIELFIFMSFVYIFKYCIVNIPDEISTDKLFKENFKTLLFSFIVSFTLFNQVEIIKQINVLSTLF